MKIAITGSMGVIGSALVRRLRSARHEVIRLVSRRPAAADEVLWYPELDTERLAGVDAVVHLIGEPLLGRWTEHRVESIRESRVNGTNVLVRGLASMGDAAPRIVLNGSSVWVYGDRGTAPLTEESPRGTGFLADVYHDAEQSADALTPAGVRVAHLRYGVVQTPQRGMLRSVLPVFRWGVGARLGSGSQPVSWVGIVDAVRATVHALSADSLAGPVNVTAPNPVSNREYADLLASRLRRPRLFAMPRTVLRLQYGTAMTDEVLLSGSAALPKRLLDTGFQFHHETLDAAFADLLSVPADDLVE